MSVQPLTAREREALEFSVEVRTWIPRTAFKRVHALAVAQQASVADVIAKLVQAAVDAQPDPPRLYSPSVQRRADRIRNAYQLGVTVPAISESENVTRSYVYKILRGER